MARDVQQFAIAVMVGAVGGGLPPGGPAQAQSVDYSAMEQLFGEPVTTSVTGKPQRVTDAPANIEIITQDDIRRSGATTSPTCWRSSPASMCAAMGSRRRCRHPRLQPGQQPAADGADQRPPGLHGRLRPYRQWDTLPVQLDEIRQIEVINGPNSALYGFNAISGVINIITYDPLQENINAATLRGGTQNLASGSAVATGKIGESVGVRLSAGGMESSDYPPGPLPASDAASRLRPFTGMLNADTRVQISSGSRASSAAVSATHGFPASRRRGLRYRAIAHQFGARRP